MVQGGGIVKTDRTQEIDGEIYECWSVKKNVTPTNTKFLENIYVAYPKAPYEQRIVSLYADLIGTYYEETTESVLAQAVLTINLKDFDFIDPPGVIYNVIKNSYGVWSTYIKNHCDSCYDNGAINSQHLSDSSTEYYSDMTLYFNYIKEYSDFYDLEFVDDIMDVMTTDGDYRRLNDDEFNFTKVVIPSVSEIPNANGFAIEADKYTVEVYIRKANNADFETTPYQTTVITNSSQTIKLPDDTAAVKIIVKNIQESLQPMTIKLYYKFHTTAEDIVLNNGAVINYMYFNDYDDEGNWDNSEFDGNRELYPSDELFNRDLELYGHTYDREKYTLHVIEVPNEHSSSTSFSKVSENNETYYFTGGINNSFNIAEGNTLSEFSTYTILPDGIKLQPLYSTSSALYDCLNFSSSNYSSAFIKEHAEIEIIENYKDSGRTYVAIHYDFSDSPITPTTISVSGIPMYYERDNLKDASKSFSLRTITLIDQSGKWYATSTDNNNMESGLWKDIDGDGDTSETAAYSYWNVTIYNPESSNLQFTKSVKTSLTNGYVQPSIDSATQEYVEEEIPYTYKNYEYSYKLRLRTGESLAKNVIFVDVLETGDRAEWQGTFQRVDTSYAEQLLGTKPTVYYSSEAVDANSKPDFTSSVWTTSKPSNVKSIAVDFGEAMLQSGSSLYVEIYMKSPKNEDDSLENKLTENFAHVYYDKYDSASELYLGSNDLPSNDIPVSLTHFMGTIKIIKLDSTSQDKLSGAKFTLYEMLGDKPDTSVDTVVTENLTTNSIGVASIKVPYGNYYVIETTAPLGYKINSEPQEIVLNADEPDITVTVKLENDRKEGQFTLRKVSDRNSDLYLPGATFSVYTEDGKLVQENLVTDKNGELTVSGLEWGNYYIQETKAPDGYMLSDEKISFTVHAENDAQDTATVKNEQIPATVILVKTEVLEDGTTKTDEPLDGAAYQLYDSDDNLIGTYMTDENGKIYVDDLDFGTYYFKETIAAQGYELYTEKIQFTIDGKDLQKDNTVSKTVETTDTRLLGSLWLQKLDDVGDYVKNAEFALFRESDDVQVDETGQESTKTYKTSAEGVIEIVGLYWGEYYLKEIEAPVGYDISDTKYSFVIDRTTVNKKVTFNATNNRSKGTVELLKVSKADNEITLKGAVYTLYKNDGTVYRDDLVTDENGIITVKDIEWGSYYFLEKTPPENYGLSDEKIRFSVNYLTAGKVQKLTAEDPEITGEIVVTKRIKFSDIVFAHGNPTFTFKLVGTDTNGNTYTYYKNIVFNEDFVNSYATANPDEEYIEQSVVFTGLPAGTWRASETDTVRYTLDKAEALTDNGTVGNDSVSFELGDSFGYEGEARFTNGKAVQTSTSHTSLAVNIAKAERKLTAIVALWQGEKIITSYTLDRTQLDVYAVYDDGTQVKLADDAYTLDSETFDETMQGDYTVTATYSEGGKTFSDSFVLNLKIPAPFTWTVTESAFEEDGISYDGTATITGYTGTSSVLNIPSKVVGIRTLEDYDTGEVSYVYNEKTYKVVGTIGNITYYENVGITTSEPIYGVSEIEKIIVPSTVEEIGNSSFGGCKKLTELTIEENSNLKKIDDNAFYTSSLACEITIPKGVEYIGTSAFRGSSISKLTFEKTSQLTTINDYAFSQCSSLSGTLEIPASVTYIGENAFSNCSNLTSLIFEEGSNLETIGKRAFYYCSKLAGTLEIPASVVTIGEEAFRLATRLTGLNFEENSNLTTIGNGAFNCIAATYGVPIGNFSGSSLEIPASVISIGDYAFNMCEFGEITFEENSQLKTIGANAFSYNNCSSTSNDKVLKIPNSVTTIGNYAFYYNSSLSSLIFEDGSSVETIGDYAFAECYNLEGELKIPASVETIGNYAFCANVNNNHNNTSKLTSLVFEEGSKLKTIGNYAFSFCTELEGTIEFPASVTSIGKYAFAYNSTYACRKITGIVFAENSQLKTIGVSAFEYCSGLTGTLTIPKSVDTINSRAFKSCTSLNGLIFEDNSQLEVIYPYAFASCTSLAGTLEIPATVQSIGNYAFTECGITKLVFQDNSQLGRICEGAFYQCTALSEELILPEGLIYIDKQAFYKCSSLKGNLKIPESVETIGQAAFYNCSSLEGNLEIPANVQIIRHYAFQNCSSLTGLTFAEDSQLTEIQANAFRNCKSIAGQIEIPSSVEKIGEQAFLELSALTELTFEDGSQLSSIGTYAFGDCTLLSGTIEIPSSVTSLGSYAFRNCTSLTGVTFAENSCIETIGERAFCDCTSLTGEVTIPSTITSIGTNAFFDTAITKLYIPSTLTTTETYGLDAANVEYYDP